MTKQFKATNNPASDLRKVSGLNVDPMIDYLTGGSFMGKDGSTYSQGGIRGIMIIEGSVHVGKTRVANAIADLVEENHKGNLTLRINSESAMSKLTRYNHEDDEDQTTYFKINEKNDLTFKDAYKLYKEVSENRKTQMRKEVRSNVLMVVDNLDDLQQNDALKKMDIEYMNSSEPNTYFMDSMTNLNTAMKSLAQRGVPMVLVANQITPINTSPITGTHVTAHSRFKEIERAASTVLVVKPKSTVSGFPFIRPDWTLNRIEVKRNKFGVHTTSFIMIFDANGNYLQAASHLYNLTNSIYKGGLELNTEEGYFKIQFLDYKFTIDHLDHRNEDNDIHEYAILARNALRILMEFKMMVRHNHGTFNDALLNKGYTVETIKRKLEDQGYNWIDLLSSDEHSWNYYEDQHDKRDQKLKGIKPVVNGYNVILAAMGFYEIK